MKELLNFLVTNLVKNPKDVEINENRASTGEITLELKVNQNDMGMVIGKGGKIIKSLRNVLKTKAIIEGKKVNLVLVEEN
jgi:predicted RNA-binding protein YlqC (UPF0109 family)